MRWLGAALVLVVALLLWFWGRGGAGERGMRRAEPVADRHAAADDDKTGASGAAAAPLPPPPPVDLDAVDRDRDLFGVVVHKADGSSIAGADLTALEYPRQDLYGMPAAMRDGSIVAHTTSAEDGTFSLRLRPGQGVALLVSANGFGARIVAALQAGERVRVEMTPPVRLTVTVSDTGDHRLAGATVRFFRDLTDYDIAFDLRGATDAEGVTSFAGLPGDTYGYLDVGHPGFAWRRWIRVELPPLGSAATEVVLREGRRVSGHVTERESGASVAKARVGLDWDLFGAVETDATGYYEISGWTPDGERSVHVVADGYGRASKDIGNSTMLDFALTRADSASGRVLAPDRTQVAGALVCAFASRPYDAAFSRTRADGSFLLEALRRDAGPHTLVVMAPGLARYLLDFEPHADTPGNVDLGDIVLPEAHTIRGRVRMDGAPAPRLEVSLTGCNSDRGRLGAKPVQASQGQFEERFTDDLGRFAFPDLAPGSYTVEAGGWAKGSATCVVELGAEDVTVDLSFVGGTPYRIVVKDPTGRPLPGAWVMASTEDEGLGWSTDARGEVTIRLPDSLVEVEVSCEGYMDTRKEFGPDATEYVVTMPPLRPIFGRVLFGDGRPVTGAFVYALQDDQTISTTADDEGKFELKVGDGHYTVGVTGATKDGKHDRYAATARRENVEAGATIVLNAHPVPRERALDVVVRLPGGTPATTAVVVCAGERQPVDASGRAHVENLPADRIRVQAELREGSSTLARPLDQHVVPEGQEIVLTFRTAAPVEGVVRFADGKAAAGAKVVARDAEGRFLEEADADEKGRFSVPVAEEERGPFVVEADAGFLRGSVADLAPGTRGIVIVVK